MDVMEEEVISVSRLLNWLLLFLSSRNNGIQNPVRSYIFL